jgi:hypothetical protein
MLSLVETRLDSLRTPVDAPIVEPVAMRATGERTVVLDRANKELLWFAENGELMQRTEGVHRGDARFLTAETGLMFADRIGVYDHLDQVVRYFDDDGRFMHSDSALQSEIVRALFVLDDSTVVATHYVADRSARGLVSVLGSDLRVKHRFHRRSSFRTALAPMLTGILAVRADGVDGSIFVGMSGDDSLYQYDAQGALRAAGVIEQGSGTPLKSWPALVAANGGSLHTGDSLFVGADAWHLTNIVAVSSSRAILQLARPLPAGQRRRDLNDTILLAAATRRGDRIETVGWLTTTGSLIARHPNSETSAILLRTSEGSFGVIERSVISIAPVGRKAGC